MCPRCGRDAPILYRGAFPYCTACGALRLPLSGSSINLAGKPAKVGGAVANALGWLVLLVGLSTALGLGGILYALATTLVAVAVAVPIAVVTLIAGIVLVKSGRSLTRSGVDVERTTHETALYALASHRGAVTAAEAAAALGTTVTAADAMLTALAKREPERLAVDIDDQGGVFYRAIGDGARIEPRVRVERNARVDDPSPVQEETDAEESEERVELRR